MNKIKTIANYLCKNLFKFKIIYILLFVNQTHGNDKDLVCKDLLNVISINTIAYKNCLIQKPGEKFTKAELDICKKYYLTEIERLSYVYKNICS